jgi:hypothetical protein
MKSVDIAMSVAFISFVCIFGRRFLKGMSLFLSDHQRAVLLMVHQSEDLLDAAKVRIDQARSKNSDITKKIDHFRTLSQQKTESLSKQWEQERRVVEKKYQDLYALSMQRMLNHKKDLIRQMIIKDLVRSLLLQGVEETSLERAMRVLENTNVDDLEKRGY